MTCAIELNRATFVLGRSGRCRSALDVRRLDQRDLARVDDDQLRALTQTLLHAGGEHRVAFGRVRANDDDHVGLHHRIEVLRARGFADGVLQAVAGRRMADARAGIHVVVAERRAHELLHEERLFVRAARRRDAADRVAAVLRLDALELARRVADGHFPGDLLPRIVDRLADHRRGDAFVMRRVAVRETALDARVAVIGVAVAIGDHPDDLAVPRLGVERAADPAVRASGRRHLGRLHRAG